VTQCKTVGFLANLPESISAGITQTAFFETEIGATVSRERIAIITFFQTIDASVTTLTT
jgi:hypothetical protein